MTARSDGAAAGPTTTPPGLVRLPIQEVAPAINEIAPPIDSQPSPEPETASVVVECVVCGAVMEPTTAEDIYQHPLDKPCVAILTDGHGESIDRLYFVADDGNIYATQQPDEEAPPPVPPDDVVTLAQEPAPEAGTATAAETAADTQLAQDAAEELSEPELPDVFGGQLPKTKTRKRKTKKPDDVVLPNNAAETAEGDILIPLNPDPTIPTMEKGLLAAFDKYDLPRLGGASGDLGWSSFSTYQRCPYLFKRMYIDGGKGEGTPGRAIEIGSCFHTFAAIYYQKIIQPDYPLTPEILHAFLVEFGVKMENLMEAWRVWQGYAIEYENDYLVPLAVEYHVVDPKTKESARYDLIAKVENAHPGVVKGTYVVEHKTAGRFDDATLDGWRNDGEVLGQIMLWNRLKLNKKFGKLAGVMVNIAGKQKIQKFHRTIVPPQRWQINQHGKDLKVWQGQRVLAMATNSFPRARANCIGRWGKCSQWGHCADREK